LKKEDVNAFWNNTFFWEILFLFRDFMYPVENARGMEKVGRYTSVGK
jgi:hypothetical protein